MREAEAKVRAELTQPIIEPGGKVAEMPPPTTDTRPDVTRPIGKLESTE